MFPQLSDHNYYTCLSYNCRIFEVKTSQTVWIGKMLLDFMVTLKTKSGTSKQLSAIFTSPQSSQSLESVSYTHLDVYKRQV